MTAEAQEPNSHLIAVDSAPVEEEKTQQPVKRLKPNPGQPVGPTGAQVSAQICKSIIEAVKSGDRERVASELARFNVELRDIVDMGQYNQNLCFTCCQVEDESKGIDMLDLMVSSGVDLFQKDNLKQTPLFYAAKGSKERIMTLLIENGIGVNDIDTYG